MVLINQVDGDLDMVYAFRQCVERAQQRNNGDH